MRKPEPAGGIDAARALLAHPDDFTFVTDTASGKITAIPKQIDTRDLLPRVRAIGVPLGTVKGKDFVPSHEIALSVARNSDLPTAELLEADARRYLRKETFALPETAPTGWILATFQGQALGWMKHLPDGRVNNYLPSEWRLRRGD